MFATIRIHLEEVVFPSPGSRSAPWVTEANVNGTPTGYYCHKRLPGHNL